MFPKTMRLFSDFFHLWETLLNFNDNYWTRKGLCKFLLPCMYHGQCFTELKSCRSYLCLNVRKTLFTLPTAAYGKWDYGIKSYQLEYWGEGVNIKQRLHLETFQWKIMRNSLASRANLDGYRCICSYQT